MAEEKGKLGILIVVAVLCLVVSAVVTYFVVGQIKQTEINNLKNQYDAEISDLDNQIGNLQNTLNILNADNQNYTKNMVKGLQKFAEGDYFWGAAQANKLEAESDYEDEFYYLASWFSSIASLDYAESSNNYSLAKSFFEEAKQNASNNKTIEVAQLFISLSDVSSKTTSELSEAFEDFSSACDYYYNNNYAAGDLRIETMNDHVETSNTFFASIAGYESDIDALLENFSID